MYSEWIAVPVDKSTFISEIKENKKFQIRSDKKLDESNDIRWTLKGPYWLWFTTEFLHAFNCNETRKYFSNEERANNGFFHRAGVLTFLKTNAHLKIWFEDVLEVTWIYENSTCSMTKTMTGLRFRTPQGKLDKVSTHYRYAIGDVITRRDL